MQIMQAIFDQIEAIANCERIRIINYRQPPIPLRQPQDRSVFYSYEFLIPLLKHSNVSDIVTAIV